MLRHRNVVFEVASYDVVFIRFVLTSPQPQSVSGVEWQILIFHVVFMQKNFRVHLFEEGCERKRVVSLALSCSDLSVPSRKIAS